MKSLEMSMCLLSGFFLSQRIFFVCSGGFSSFLVLSLPVLYGFLQLSSVFLYICFFHFPSFYIFMIQLNIHPSFYAKRNLMLFFVCFFLRLIFFILFPSHYIFNFFVLFSLSFLLTRTSLT
jgi:hypothetical protein